MPVENQNLHVDRLSLTSGYSLLHVLDLPETKAHYDSIKRSWGKDKEKLLLSIANDFGLSAIFHLDELTQAIYEDQERRADHCFEMALRCFLDENRKLARKLDELHSAHIDLPAECIICGWKGHAVSVDDRISRIYGVPSPYCTSCGWWRRDMEPFWTEELAKSIRRLKDIFRTVVDCEVCGSPFLLGEPQDEPTRVFARNARQALHLGAGRRWEKSPAGSLLFLNAWFNVCPECAWKTVTETEQHSRESMILFLSSISTITNAIPGSNFNSLLHICREAASVRQTFSLLASGPTYQQIKKEFGNILVALKKARVLDEASRRGTFGMLCSANDGHLCHSLAEKQIDDWFSSQGIQHSREPRYPGSSLRADWGIQLNGEQIFVEYWGLKGQEAYDQKIVTKRTLAQVGGIALIEISPGMDWKRILIAKLSLGG